MSGGFSLKNKHRIFTGLASVTLLLTLAQGTNTAQASGGGVAPDQMEQAQPQATEQAQSNGIQLTNQKPELAPVQTENAPSRVTTNFKGDTKSEMGFNWFTTDKFDDAKVWISETGDFSDAQVFDAKTKKVDSKYLERDKNGNIIFEDVKKDDDGEIIKDKNGNETINGYYTDAQASGPQWTAGDIHGKANLTKQKEYNYKVQAKGLKPNTNYYFYVGSESGPKSEVGQFKTSGNNGDSFKFIQYADTQNAYWNENVRDEALFGADTLNQAINTAGNADFVVHSGDVVEHAEVEDEWKDLYDRSRPSFMKMAMAPVPGNHDEYALDEDDDKLLGSFNDHFNVPKANNAMNGGSYYSFDYNGAHMVVANTNDNKKGKDNPEGKALGKDQMEWIKKDIKQARENGANWIIFNLHKPMYAHSFYFMFDDEIKKVHKELVKQLDELDVDLVLQGHDHVLSRSKVLQYSNTKNSFADAKVEDAKQVTGDDGVTYYDNPKGSVYVIPNMGGTKAIADLGGRSLEEIKHFRPEFKDLTQKQLDHFHSLFEIADQPQKTDAFDIQHTKNSDHVNNRDSSDQNYAVYEVDEDELKVKIYQLHGDIAQGEPRRQELIDEFGIKKDK